MTTLVTEGACVAEMPLSEVKVSDVCGPQVMSPDECGRIILNKSRMLVTNQRPELARVKNPPSSIWSLGPAMGFFLPQTLGTELLTQPWLILNLTVFNCIIFQGAGRIMGIPRQQIP